VQVSGFPPVAVLKRARPKHLGGALISRTSGFNVDASTGDAGPGQPSDFHQVGNLKGTESATMIGTLPMR
jgi:hypothetical protein